MYETYKVKCKWLQTKENFADFIQKKKLRLQGAGMFAMSLTTSKKKDSYAAFESEMNKKPRLQTPVSAKTF